MILLLLQLDWNKATGLFGLVCLVGAAIIVLLSRKKEEAYAAEKASADALKRLLETRERELEEERKKVAKLAGELETTAGEYRQLASVDVRELINADKLRRENESLRGDVEFWKGRANAK